MTFPRKSVKVCCIKTNNLCERERYEGEWVREERMCVRERRKRKRESERKERKRERGRGGEKIHFFYVALSFR